MGDEVVREDARLIARNFSSGTLQRSSHLRVLQWNILADGLSKSSPTENFCAVPPEYLSWSYRSVLIAKQLDCLQADIICLEEVDHFHDFFVPMLSSNGYSGDFLQKKHSPCLHFEPNNGPDGVCMFFKSSKFDMIDSYAEYLDKETGVVGNQGFLVKVLKHRETQQFVLVCVLHLKAKRDFHARRLAQTQSALKILEKILQHHGGQIPVIWCGDFNGENTEDFFKEISKSKFSVQSSYKSFLGNEPEYTTWKIRPSYEEKHTIDYVFFSADKLDVKDVLHLMSDEEIPKSRFPSFNHPSDHVCLCVDFDFISSK